MASTCRERKLREKVMIQCRTRTTNSSGEVVRTWSDLDERSAEVQFQSSTESVVGGRQTVSETQYRVTLRSDSLTRTLRSTMRLVWNGVTLNIGGKIQTGERHEWVELTCTERADPE